MNTKYDDEIREAEARLMRDRQALIAQAEDLSAKARETAAKASATASSPKGLLAAFAVGFVLGELTAPRRPRKSSAAQTVDTTKKVGIGGLIGSALFAYARSHYGSPWALGRSAWGYYAQMRQARQAAMRRQASTMASAARSGPTSAAPVAPVTPVRPTYPEAVHSPERHAAG
jgi:hypothetical protein